MACTNRHFSSDAACVLPSPSEPFVQFVRIISLEFEIVNKKVFVSRKNVSLGRTSGDALCRAGACPRRPAQVIALPNQKHHSRVTAITAKPFFLFQARKISYLVGGGNDPALLKNDHPNPGGHSHFQTFAIKNHPGSAPFLPHPSTRHGLYRTGNTQPFRRIPSA